MNRAPRNLPVSSVGTLLLETYPVRKIIAVSMQGYTRSLSPRALGANASE